MANEITIKDVENTSQEKDSWWNGVIDFAQEAAGAAGKISGVINSFKDDGDDGDGETITVVQHSKDNTKMYIIAGVAVAALLLLVLLMKK